MCKAFNHLQPSDFILDFARVHFLIHPEIPVVDGGIHARILKEGYLLFRCNCFHHLWLKSIIQGEQHYTAV